MPSLSPLCLATANAAAKQQTNTLGIVSQKVVVSSWDSKID